MRIVQLPPSRSVPAHRFYAQARSSKQTAHLYACVSPPLPGSRARDIYYF